MQELSHNLPPKKKKLRIDKDELANEVNRQSTNDENLEGYVITRVKKGFFSIFGVNNLQKISGILKNFFKNKEVLFMWQTKLPLISTQKTFQL